MTCGTWTTCCSRLRARASASPTADASCQRVPRVQKVPRLVGNYGSSWWHQRDEFEAFGGPIVMTTNCLVEPRDSYRDRIFTTSVVGWPGVQHIPERPEGGQKDFSAVIAKALTCDSPKELETGTIPIGFAHNTVLSVADKVIEAIQAGALKRFVVVAGCDGRHRAPVLHRCRRALPGYHRLHGRLRRTVTTSSASADRRDPARSGCPNRCSDSYSLVVEPRLAGWASM